jgi:ATP-dependent Clp protease ATP-binding subunit ClpC
MKQPRGFNFTETVRQALARARTEALTLRHEYVGTEHILLGLVAAGPNVATRIIEESGVRPDSLVETIYENVKRGTLARQDDPSLPYTSRAKKVLELAMKEASGLDHDYVGSEHALLGLIREEKGIAAQVLVDAGIDLDAAREQVRRMHKAGIAECTRLASPTVTPRTGPIIIFLPSPARREWWASRPPACSSYGWPIPASHGYSRNIKSMSSACTRR